MDTKTGLSEAKISAENETCIAKYEYKEGMTEKQKENYRKNKKKKEKKKTSKQVEVVV